jgi:hypothetical protein
LSVIPANPPGLIIQPFPGSIRDFTYFSEDRLKNFVERISVTRRGEDIISFFSGQDVLKGYRSL